MRGRSVRPPICSVHNIPAQKGVDGWFCRSCLNEHVHRKREGRSVGGVVLPVGVKLETPDYAGDILPNRRARRRR